MNSELLMRAEAALRSRGPAPIPEGLAERATKAAFSAASDVVSFFDQFFRIGWKTAAIACVAVAVLALWPRATDDHADNYDPLEVSTSMPTVVADPTYAALGGVR